MKKLDPDKLSVEYKPGVTPFSPISPRRYTLTHSDETGELFLTIGPEYDYTNVNPMRDEVLGEWRYEGKEYIFFGKVYVNGKFGPIQAGIRNRIFIRELPLALEAIRYGDRKFFNANPALKDAHIYIYFESSYPRYDREDYWGTFQEYI